MSKINEQEQTRLIIKSLVQQKDNFYAKMGKPPKQVIVSLHIYELLYKALMLTATFSCDKHPSLQVIGVDLILSRFVPDDFIEFIFDSGDQFDYFLYGDRINT